MGRYLGSNRELRGPEKIINLTGCPPRLENKEAYLEKLQAKLEEWTAEIDRLKAKAAGANIDLRNEIDTRVGDLESRRQKVEDRMQQLREFSEKSQKDIMDRLQRAWQDLSYAVQAAKEKFK